MSGGNFFLYTNPYMHVLQNFSNISLPYPVYQMLNWNKWDDSKDASKYVSYKNDSAVAPFQGKTGTFVVLKHICFCAYK